MIPPEVGRALQADSLRHNESALTNAFAKSALNFFHDTQHFTHGKLIITRLLSDYC